MRQRQEDGGGGWQEGMHALLLGGRSPLLPELHGRRITAPSNQLEAVGCYPLQLCVCNLQLVP